MKIQLLHKQVPLLNEFRPPNLSFSFFSKQHSICPYQTLENVSKVFATCSIQLCKATVLAARTPSHRGLTIGKYYLYIVAVRDTTVQVYVG